MVRWFAAGFDSSHLLVEPRQVVYRGERLNWLIVVVVDRGKRQTVESAPAAAQLVMAAPQPGMNSHFEPPTSRATESSTISGVRANRRTLNGFDRLSDPGPRLLRSPLSSVHGAPSFSSVDATAASARSMRSAENSYTLGPGSKSSSCAAIPVR